MNATERGIFEQFPFWQKASLPASLTDRDKTYVIIGCGTSYNLAMAIAAQFNLKGLRAIAVPAGEWLHRPFAHLPEGVAASAIVIALSRSGESTETVLAAQECRKRKQYVIGITCEDGSSLTKHVDRVLYFDTHPDEGIVMTASASLMLMAGFALAGCSIADQAEITAAAETLLGRFAQTDLSSSIGGRLFVFLGGGTSYGVAVEGALKMQEMSLSNTQAFHPMEYRHGPVSLADDNAFVALLYSKATRTVEEKLQSELSAKGAFVLGLGGPGDSSLAVPVDDDWTPLVVLPVLQLLGERVAQAKSLDTGAPRHLTKVVRLI